MVLGYLALSVMAGIVFSFGASLGYRRGCSDTRKLVQRARHGPAKRQCGGHSSDPLAGLPEPVRRRHRVAHMCRAGPRTLSRTARAHRGVRGVEPEGPVTAQLAHPPLVSLAPWRRSRLLRQAAVAVVLTFALATPSTIAYADMAAPGHPLWAAKLQLEAARLALETDPSGDAALHLEFAARRLSDLAVLLTRDADAKAVERVAANLERNLDGLAVAMTPQGDARPPVPAVQADLQQRLLDHVAVLGGLARSGCAVEQLGQEGCENLQQAVARSEVVLADVGDDIEVADSAGSSRAAEEPPAETSVDDGGAADIAAREARGDRKPDARPPPETGSGQVATQPSPEPSSLEPAVPTEPTPSDEGSAADSQSAPVDPNAGGSDGISGTSPGAGNDAGAVGDVPVDVPIDVPPDPSSPQPPRDPGSPPNPEPVGPDLRPPHDTTPPPDRPSPTDPSLPSPTEPDATAPLPAKPRPVTPRPADPDPTDPDPTDPTDPDPTDPDPTTDPTDSGPATGPSDPSPTDPGSTDPAPSDPLPSKPSERFPIGPSNPLPGIPIPADPIAPPDPTDPSSTLPSPADPTPSDLPSSNPTPADPTPSDRPSSDPTPSDRGQRTPSPDGSSPSETPPSDPGSDPPASDPQPSESGGGPGEHSPDQPTLDPSPADASPVPKPALPGGTRPDRALIGGHPEAE
jgi:hypothetical protein